MACAWKPGSGPRAARAGALSLPDLATLFAVGVVVVLVSLPSLRRFALAENESDALQMTRLLGVELAPLLAKSESPPDLAALLESRADLSRRLGGWKACGAGRVLRHGYLFDLVARPSDAGVRAWPWKQGETGLGAFAWSSRAGLVGHANQDGRFSGPADPPPWPESGRSAEGWRRLAPE